MFVLKGKYVGILIHDGACGWNGIWGAIRLIASHARDNKAEIQYQQTYTRAIISSAIIFLFVGDDDRFNQPYDLFVLNYIM